jgi:hypothetical protein
MRFSMILTPVLAAVTLAGVTPNQEDALAKRSLLSELAAVTAAVSALAGVITTGNCAVCFQDSA